MERERKRENVVQYKQLELETKKETDVVNGNWIRLLPPA
jgi:hypothetical protein